MTEVESELGFLSRYRSALERLTSAQKTPKGASYYTLRVNRPAGRRFAAAAATLGATPNQVTAVSGVFSLTAIVLLAVVEPSVWLGVLVGAMLVLAFMLDSADGQVARLLGTSSARGEWIDHVLDCAVKLALHAAVLIAWYRADEPAGWLALALAFQFVSVLVFFGGILVGKMRENRPSGGSAGTAAERPGRLRPLVLLPVDYGVLCASFLLWGWQDVFVVVYAALFVVTALSFGAFGSRWLRELS